MHDPSLNFEEGSPTGNSTQGTILPLWSAVIPCSVQDCRAHLMLCLFLFSFSKHLQAFSFENYHTIASCRDYTNNLIIPKQYAVRCSNTTTQQQSILEGQFSFTICKEKPHRWRPPPLSQFQEHRIALSFVPRRIFTLQLPRCSVYRENAKSWSLAE